MVPADFSNDGSPAPRLRAMSPAKINWFLEVRHRREDGYHELETVMSRVSLCDVLEFSIADSELSLELVDRGDDASRQLPPPGENLVIETLKRFREAAKVDLGMQVKLVKNIPVQAGLGGASSNAATALLAANQLWRCHWSREQLNQVAMTLGSDISFFLYRGNAVCRGRGECVSPIPAVYGHWVLIVKPPVGFSTRELFAELELPSVPLDSNDMVRALANGDPLAIGNQMFNRFERAARRRSRWGEWLTAELNRLGAIASQITGSGSCYYGLFRNRFQGLAAAAAIKARFVEVETHVCRTLPDLGRLE